MGLALSLLGCASDAERRGVVDDRSPLQTELGFMRDPAIRRQDIEARLGAPSASFEGGRIVSYAVRYDASRKRLGLVPEQEHPSKDVSGARNCYGLMIAYEADGRVMRYALVRQGSAHCPKTESIL
jgi:hypothetical protein